MKVLRLTTLLDFGGQEKQFVNFTEKPNLLKNYYVFAAIGFGGNAEKILRKRGFEVHILNRNFSIGNLSNIWAVYQLIKKVKPDVVHTAAAEANFHGIIAAKLAGVPYIIGEEIGIPNHSKMAQKIFSLVYRLADKVICVSKAVKDRLVAIGEIPSTKGVVIYNPVSTPPSIDFAKKTSFQFEIVYVGRLEKVKNVETLIRAFSKINKEGVLLTIVGDGRERKNLENLALELGINHTINFVGFTPNPYEHLCGADLFVLPSYSEGFGIAAVEAMLLKVPVICSKVGGIPEFIIDGVNGWLFDPNSESELEDKINYIISLTPERINQVVHVGYSEVINKFTIDIYIENLEKLYFETFNSNYK